MKRSPKTNESHLVLVTAKKALEIKNPEAEDYQETKRPTPESMDINALSRTHRKRLSERLSNIITARPKP